MKQVIILLLMILTLDGCVSVTQRLACAQIKKHQIPLVPKCEISFQFVRCRCRCFDYNNWNTVPLNKCERFAGEVGNTKDFELSYCDGIDGSFLSDEATAIRPNVKALANIRANLCE